MLAGATASRRIEALAIVARRGAHIEATVRAPPAAFCTGPPPTQYGGSPQQPTRCFVNVAHGAARLSRTASQSAPPRCCHLSVCLRSSTSQRVASLRLPMLAAFGRHRAAPWLRLTSRFLCRGPGWMRALLAQFERRTEPPAFIAVSLFACMSASSRFERLLTYLRAPEIES